VQVLALGGVLQAAKIVQVVAGGLLQKDRLVRVNCQPGQADIFINPALHDPAVHGLAEQALRLLENGHLAEQARPAFLPAGCYLRIGIIEADELEFLGMGRDLPHQAVGVRVPHSQHCQTHGHESSRLRACAKGLDLQPTSEPLVVTARGVKLGRSESIRWPVSAPASAP
jgi:hypothetical protein